MKDILGQEITVGCTIAYPDRRGSALWLNTGTVTEVDLAVRKYDMRLGWYQDGERVRVRSVTHRWTRHEKRTRDTWVRAIERVVVVRPAPMLPSVGSSGTINSAEVGDLSIQMSTGHA